MSDYHESILRSYISERRCCTAAPHDILCAVITARVRRHSAALFCTHTMRCTSRREHQHACSGLGRVGAEITKRDGMFCCNLAKSAQKPTAGRSLFSDPRTCLQKRARKMEAAAVAPWPSNPFAGFSLSHCLYISARIGGVVYGIVVSWREVRAVHEIRICAAKLRKVYVSLQHSSTHIC